MAVFHKSRLGSSCAPQALDVEQGLLQHHQLRLDFDVEPARGLEQAQQHAAEGDFVQRPVEDRLADGADRRLEFIDARVGRRPAGLDVRFATRL